MYPSSSRIGAWGAVFTFIVLLLSSSFSVASGGTTPKTFPACITDPQSVEILQNTSMTYREKFDLYNACSEIEQDWYATVRSLLNGNVSEVVLPPKPVLVPQILRLFPLPTPNLSINAFTFQHSAVRYIMNTTAAGVRCGLDCKSAMLGAGAMFLLQGTAYAEPDVLGTTLENTTLRFKNGTNVTVTNVVPIYSNTSADIQCLYSVPEAFPFDSVCTAYIQYNSTYWENATLYTTLPMGAAAVLDASTTTVSVGVTTPLTIWLPPALQFCPWYYNLNSFSKPDPRESTYAALTVMLTASYTSSTGSEQAQSELRLQGANCDIATAGHPANGGPGVRIRGTLTPAQVTIAVSAKLSFPTKNITYNVTLDFLRLSYLMDLVPIVATNAAALAMATSSVFPGYAGAPLKFEGLIEPSLSAWWPMENYSQPGRANAPKRCYATAPVFMDGSPTTLYLPTLSCTTGYAVLALEIINHTAFCCVWNATSSSASDVASFKWTAFIVVYDAAKFWFTDTAGIVATPAPSLPPRLTGSPGAGEGSSSGGSGSFSAQSSMDASSMDVGDLGGTMQGETALILGVALVCVGAAAAVMAVVYFKWWKPRYDSGGGAVKNTMNDADRSEDVSALLMLDGMRDDDAAAAMSPLTQPAPAQRGGGGNKDLFFDEVEPTQEEMDEL